MFTSIQYGTYNICPGPVFQCEFNGGVLFVIRLTIFGNFFVLYVCICIIQCEFNGSVHFTIRLTIFGNSFVLYVCIFVIHHFSMWIQWQCSFYNQPNHIWQFLCFICMYICYTPFFSVNSAIKSYYVIWRLYSRNIWYGHHQALFFILHLVVIIMSSGDYVIIIYNMVITRHHFSFCIQWWPSLYHPETIFL